METTSVPTFTATICLGLRKAYTNQVCHEDEVIPQLRAWCDDRKICVTATKTEFVYSDGQEPGLLIGLMKYPRFPREKAKLREMALELAEILLHSCRQLRVSVIFPDETVMLENL